MTISEYVKQAFKESTAELIQFEIHLDSRGQVVEGGTNIVRFNLERGPIIAGHVTMKIDEEKIKKEIENLGNERRKKRNAQ